ncbi:MAG: hypothetical protein ACFNQH_02090, partial [Veillonella parvula]
MLNHVGEKNNKLEIIGYSHKSGRKHYWKCKCDCGKETVVAIDHLKSGHTKSCGCVNSSHRGSEPELDIFKFVSSFLNVGVEQHNKSILDGKEIDNYIPDLKIGIEYCGSAFHASEGSVFNDKPKYYHRDKFLLAKSKGINLITIFDKDY